MTMAYNFDEMIPRRGTNSIKWDLSEEDGVIPMWVADMDFRVAPDIAEALRARVEHGVFGYTHVPDAYYDAVTGWFASRHGFSIDRKWILYIPGVVPALTAIVKALTSPGDKVLIQPPVYNCFFSVVANNGCGLAENPLIYRDNAYTIDFEDLERKASDPLVKVMILCNPHNPAGRVWTRNELERIGEICLRNDVFVIADEIHCEITSPGHDYVPFASISDEFLMNSVSCSSPSKAFNLAGMQISNIVCASSKVRRAIARSIDQIEQRNVNPFGVDALIAAYGRCGDWLDEVRAYIHGNYQYMLSVFNDEVPGFPVLPLEGTYLAWVNCSALGIGSQEIEDRLKSEWKVWVNAGVHYGQEGDRFIRVNLACPRGTLREGLSRLAGGLKALLSEKSV